MTAQNVYTHLQEKFGTEIVDVQLEGDQSFIKVAPSAVLRICTYLKENPEFDFNHLMCLSSIDYGDNLGVVYHLNAMWKRIKICVKVDLPRQQPEVDSVVSVWKTADWHEREAFDLLGIKFKNHPNLERILMPDDFLGHPLQKDYPLKAADSAKKQEELRTGKKPEAVETGEVDG